MRRYLSLLAGLLAATLALTACGTSGSGDSGTTEVTVGASPVPHAKILQYVRDNLAKDAGIELEIKEFDDYVLPNSALNDGSLDANYYQHLPYLENEMSQKGYKFTHGAGIHIEPLSVFSRKYGYEHILTLHNLEKAGLLQNLTKDATVLSLTAEQNPRGFKFEENQPEVIVQLLDDSAIDLAFINSNFILSAGLNTSGALLVEEVEDNPYANLLVWREDNTNPGVQKLDELLHSQQVKDFIKTTWPEGEVIAAK